MALQITDDETCRQAVELAKLTGTTPAEAVAAAVKENLKRERKRQPDDSPEANTKPKTNWERFFEEAAKLEPTDITREEIMAWRREGLL